MATRMRSKAHEASSVPPPQNDPLKPSQTLLMKLGSIAVHADEMSGPDEHPFDEIAMEGLIKDPEVQQWIAAMGALLPAKRRM